MENFYTKEKIYIYKSVYRHMDRVKRSNIHVIGVLQRKG